MDYNYENLGDERFQEFCQALLAKEFKNMQAFPVGQPDGGRDLIIRYTEKNASEFIVYQIKYVRNANTINDLHKWLVKVIKDEIPKIKKLILKGAKQYCLITNVKGTAHLEKGAIDLLHNVLTDSIPIPTICLWRDDLSRRIESEPMIKWSFPEILNGQDILNSVIFANLHEKKNKRETAIKSYLADQYRIDNEVKFKQIDLQNRLLELYTDIPIRIKKYNTKNKSLSRALEPFTTNYLKSHTTSDEALYLEQNTVGAAEFILDSKVQNEISKILLEGGPGQGKSTISQYVCQIHRIRLLNKESDMNLVPEKFIKSSIRLPFKIDLRDLASWIENKNPYLDILNDEFYKKNWQKSLESFLIGHILYHSKIADFDTFDFFAVCKTSAVLIVFDGFDEIADMKIRNEVIDFINKGINRIAENAISLQVLITSRPAAFSDTIGFSVDTYPHFELTNITPQISKEYVEKWIKANHLEGKEGSEIKRLVSEKLELPHLRELAKSPMQLAIFISLLRTRGESLPHKRTALYDSYIELFFNRESEKDITIRDNRDLIIDIHRYLAWILHSEAELYRNSGVIRLDDLNNRLKEYLETEGHDVSLATKLFDVMKERVCALVSRVQGTFEFEVQPLREYFCARFLYETAPYSPIGAERTGTKPDRFETISRNFYWQNVVRFFAGCFDKGELPMLIEKLEELQEDPLLKYTNYPKLLTSQLLSDWVFTQYPKLLKNVIAIIISGVDTGNILNQDLHAPNAEPILLPKECGGEELVKECFNQLKQFPAFDYANEFIQILKNHPYNISENWTITAKLLKGEKLTKWLKYGYHLQVLYKVELNVLVEIAKENKNQVLERIRLIINSNRIDVIDSDLELKQAAFNAILNGDLSIIRRSQKNHSLYFLNNCLRPDIFLNIASRSHFNSENSLINILNDMFKVHTGVNHNLHEFEIHDIIDKKIHDFYNEAKIVLNSKLHSWQNSVEPWDKLVEIGRNLFGENSIQNILANVASSVTTKEERYDDYNELDNTSLSLCKRVRCARFKSGNFTYWENQFKNNNNIVFKLFIFFTWATPRTVARLLPIITNKVDSLNLNDFIKLGNMLSVVGHNSRFTTLQIKTIESELVKNIQSDNIKYLLCMRFNTNRGSQFLYKYIGNYSIKVRGAFRTKLSYLIELFMQNPTSTKYLNEIKDIYSLLHKNSNYIPYYLDIKYLNIDLPINVSNMIMQDLKSYPRIIVLCAEKACRKHSFTKLQAVGKIAVKNKWFNQLQSIR